MPDFTKTFIIKNDACKGIGVVLMQEGPPLTFMSKALIGKNLKNEKKMQAIVQAITH